MRRVTCQECRKIYDYDVDDFCPRCGAYNMPGRDQRSSLGLDGLSEDYPEGSFLHEELHAENAERKRLKLSRGVVRIPRSGRSNLKGAAKPSGSTAVKLSPPLSREDRRSGNGAELQGMGKIILWIVIALFMLLELLSR